MRRKSAAAELAKATSARCNAGTRTSHTAEFQQKRTDSRSLTGQGRAGQSHSIAQMPGEGRTGQGARSVQMHSLRSRAERQDHTQVPAFFCQVAYV